MRKSDLKNGAIVETREGEKYILLKNTNILGAIDEAFVNIASGCYLNLHNFNEDLTNLYDKDFDIMKVSQEKYIGDTFRNHVLKYDENNWTWEREEEVVMTISEIEEKLGIKGLKIKKED